MGFTVRPRELCLQIRENAASVSEEVPIQASGSARYGRAESALGSGRQDRWSILEHDSPVEDFVHHPLRKLKRKCGYVGSAQCGSLSEKLVRAPVELAEAFGHSSRPLRDPAEFALVANEPVVHPRPARSSELFPAPEGA